MAWNDTGKPPDRTKPIHRINMLALQPPEPQADGFGYRCKCRSPNDVPPPFFDIKRPGDSARSVKRDIARELIRAIPGWVGVKADGREREVEGALSRSFQTWTDVPVFQWHRYYDWNFHVTPADGVEYIRGSGNTQDTVPPPFQHVTSATSMELEWDCGSWFGGATDLFPGLMFARDLCWPMTNQYMWATGRWIFDCGHASSFDKTGPTEGKMRTELHPVKAIATGRWEAVQFDENPFPVPAIQFMFFASKFGGYSEFSTITDRDYEFIVDLPDHGFPPGQLVNIGHTMADPLNTAAARGPELVKKIDFTPFGNARGNVQSVNPVVTVISYNPPQAKVKIPMSTLPTGADAFGVLLSLGWKDPDKKLAQKVKKVTVTIDKVVAKMELNKVLSETWLVKVGVNGRWFAKRENPIKKGTSINFSKKVEMFLSDDDTVVLSSHGSLLNLVHDVFSRPLADRTLPGVTDYEADLVNCSDATSLTRLDDMIAIMFTTFNDTNLPLGLIDPARPAAGPSNPLTIGGAALGEQSFELKAFFTKEVGRSAELAEDPGRHEYSLLYRVKIEKVPGL